MDGAEALEHFKNDIAKIKRNLSSIVTISAMGVIGAFAQFDSDDISTFLKLDHNAQGIEAIFDHNELKEAVFIHLYKLASETRILLYSCENFLGKFELEHDSRVVQSLSDKLDY